MTTNWTLERTSNPSNLPVSLAEVKAHLRIASSDTSHDDHLTLLLAAAAERLEQDIDRQFINATYKLTLFDWPGPQDEVHLHRRQVQSITSVAYVDADGNPQSLVEDTGFTFDAGRSSIFPMPGECWPTVEADNHKAITITFVSGYGTTEATVPRLLKAAILLTVGKWFSDPAQEASSLHSQETAYQNIVMLLMRASYP